MGERYILSVLCSSCGYEDNDVWFAPTCGATKWTCPICKTVVDLCELTGISYEDASNASELASIIDNFDKEWGDG